MRFQSAVLRLVLVCFCAVAAVQGINVVANTEFDVRRVIPGNQMQGITFTPNGDLYMSRGATSMYCKYPNAVNLPIGGTLSNGICQVGPQASINIVSSQTGRIYNTFGYELDKDTWQPTKRWVDCGASHGIAVDPRDGAIFVSSAASGCVWRIPNPDNYAGVYQTDCKNDLFFNLSAAGYGTFDAITIGPDGTLYGAGNSQNRFVIVSPWTPATPKGTLVIAKPTVSTTPDGISICVSNGNSYALVSMNYGSGSIAKFNLSGPGGAPIYAESLVANAVGGYLDFTAVDPKGCIWGTTIFDGGQGVYRVTNADGTCGCSFAQAPPPPTSSACPACSNIHTVNYQGQQGSFATDFASQSNCAVLQFQ